MAKRVALGRPSYGPVAVGPPMLSLHLVAGDANPADRERLAGLLRHGSSAWYNKARTFDVLFTSGQMQGDMGNKKARMDWLSYHVYKKA